MPKDSSEAKSAENVELHNKVEITEDKTKKKENSVARNNNIDEFMRNTAFVPGCSPNYIVFCYYEDLGGYNVSNYHERMTNKVIPKQQVLEVFSNLRKIEYYNYMEMYDKMRWFNILMIIISIIQPLISLPIVCCLTKKVREGFSIKAHKRCEEFKDCQRKFNREVFVRKGWCWKVGPQASWIELRRTKHHQNYGSKELSVDVAQERNIQEKKTKSKKIIVTEKRVSKEIFGNGKTCNSGLSNSEFDINTNSSSNIAGSLQDKLNT